MASKREIELLVRWAVWLSRIQYLNNGFSLQHQPGFQVLYPGQLPEGEQGGGAGQAGWAGQRLDAEQSEPPLRPPPRLQGQ